MRRVNKRSLQVVNEHFEPIFNTAMATQVVFQQPARQFKTALLLILCALSGLLGCANGGPGLSTMASTPELASTLAYIPVLEVDDKGAALPYEPRTNPYLSQRGRISKESVLSFIEARRALKTGDLEQARTVLLELTKTNDRLSGPWVMLGDIAMEQDNYPQAVSHYTQAIAINDSNVNAYLRLAQVQRLQGKFLIAQNTYARVLAIWPDFPEAHLNLAVLYDVYLNHPLRAQKHMEAYQFLAESENEKVAGWLEEIQQRTGIAPGFDLEAGDSDSLSYNK